jgi:hypothetical protein
MTLMCGNRLNSWNTIPARIRICWIRARRSRVCFLVAETTIPSTSMVPRLGSSRKLMQRRNVLFPEPLRPMMHTTSLGLISSEIPSRTYSLPNHLCRSVTRITGASGNLLFHLSPLCSWERAGVRV